MTKEYVDQCFQDWTDTMSVFYNIWTHNKYQNAKVIPFYRRLINIQSGSTFGAQGKFASEAILPGNKSQIDLIIIKSIQRKKKFVRKYAV